MKKRACLQITSIVLALAFLIALPAGAGAGDAPKAPPPRPLRAYVGTYTGEKSKGIYTFEFDLAAGKGTAPTLAAETASPSFLALHPSRPFLYAVNEAASELKQKDGKPGGGVSAFAVDPASGKLTPLNTRPSGGADPCHLVVDRSGKHVLVANYGGGSVEVLPILNDGSLGEPSSFIQHRGKSFLPERQGGPHAHSINLDATNRFACVADLGLDRILVYRFDTAKGKLSINNPPLAPLEGGTGPRHFIFHPGGRFAYVINEIRCTVTAFSWDGEKGILKELQSLSTLPRAREKGDSTAEVEVHPSGKFLYGSNRGNDSITAFAIDPEKGTLIALQNQTTMGKTPRHFAIDPTGAYLLAENQGSDSIVVMRIDQETGRLTPTGEMIQVPSPVCLKFFTLGRN